MKRNEDSVHISPAAVESVSRSLSGSIQPIRVSPTPAMANVILTGDLRNVNNQLQVLPIQIFTKTFQYNKQTVVILLSFLCRSLL